MRTDRIIINLLLLIFLSVPVLAMAGSLDAPVAPAAGSGMPTTTDIFNRLDTGAASSVPNSFQEPGAGPTVGTGRSLADIEGKLPVVDDANGATTAEVAAGKTFWGLNQAGGVWGPQTGANANVVDTTSGTATSADLVCGTKAWVAGVELTGTGPHYYSARFGNCNGTITDKTTNLVWMKDSSALDLLNWQSAIDQCAIVADGAYGLNDGSVAGDWRLPNKDELAGLTYGSEAVGFRTPGPFVNVLPDGYWSSTTSVYDAGRAWPVSFNTGAIAGGPGSIGSSVNKAGYYYVRCVR